MFNCRDLRLFARHVPVVLAVVLFLAQGRSAEAAFTWQQIKERFEAANPTLKAAQAAIDEAHAAEVTAYLRPNPSVTGTMDQINPFTTQPSNSGTGQDVYRPFANALPFGSVSYLHERQHKRELRLDSAKQSAAIAQSTYDDQRRILHFTLRNAFVQVLQAKAVLQNARENLDYWDHELAVNRDRFNAGDLAAVDLSRLELQRVQFEADFETATVNLRTSKIQLLQLLNDRTPIEQFDVTGPYDFSDQLLPLQDFRNIAQTTRPDLKAATQSVDLSGINHRLAVANGSTDPTFSFDFARNPPIPVYMGFSVTIPLRIFDRNQGEKARTQIDIRRTENVKDATQALVSSDVDSAYYTLVQTLNLLRPYKTKYLPLAIDVRDRIAFSYKNGGASLLDYLDSEKSYRDTRLSYLNLIGSYLTAAAQMNLAVAREVMP
ncbi:MAG TPA: TolC family protein [Acidobacteriota bacterium]|nr:TolC family protein [Acidobacteriota bacterium]